jgi:hypothetical protein
MAVVEAEAHLEEAIQTRIPLSARKFTSETCHTTVVKMICAK